MSFKKYLKEAFKDEKINQPDYKFYLFDPEKNTIHSGWEYREDAKDAQDEAAESDRILKIFSKRFLLQKGINPDNNKSWGN